jgi:hypothetical protein
VTRTPQKAHKPRRGRRNTAPPRSSQACAAVHVGDRARSGNAAGDPIETALAVGQRVSDALAVFGLLLGALDPGVALQVVTKTITRGAATVLDTCERAGRAAQLASIDALAKSLLPAPEPRRRRHRSARAVPNH